MSIIDTADVTCAICGKNSEHRVVGLCSSGLPDLDFRPSETKRSAMRFWVQRCPYCGYCAHSIDEEIAGASELLDTEHYKDLVDDPTYPELVRHFLCCSLLQENAAEYKDAGWNSLYAAWFCDDNNATERAIECRDRSFDLFTKTREMKQHIINRFNAEELLLADILRRSGRFELAIEYCNKGLEKCRNKTVVHILEFELKLAKKQDMDLYRISDVPAVDSFGFCYAFLPFDI